MTRCGVSRAPAFSRFWSSIAIAAILTTSGGCSRDQRGSDGSARLTLTIMSMMVGRELEFEQNAAQIYAKEHGIDIRVIPGYDSMRNRLSGYQRLFSNHSSEPDVAEIDVVWPTMLAEHLVDLKPYMNTELERFEPRSVRHYTVDGKVRGVPMLLDTSFLYYRKDLLGKYGYSSQPDTWDDLEKMAAAIQAGERRSGKTDFWGFLWQGSEDEGLTCNAFEWQVSEGGGNVVESDGRITVHNPAAVRAIDRAASWIGRISPPGVVDYTEEDTRSLFQAGKAAFMRHWSYADGEVAIPGQFDSVGVALIPRGSVERASVQGTIGIAVSRYSHHVPEAVEYLRYLTSDAVQRARALYAATIPSRMTALADETTVAHTPVRGTLANQFMTAVVPRPSEATGMHYENVSRAYARAVHSVLAGHETADAALARLESELAGIMAEHPQSAAANRRPTSLQR